MTTVEPKSPPRRRVTVKDLAKDLGMSVSTVSRAFYPDAIVAPATRKLVLERARAIGYKANPYAQSLITKRTQIVGLVVADITNPFYPEVMTRLTADLQVLGMNVMLVAANAPEKVDDAVHLMLTYQPDLVIILAAALSSRAVQECSEVGSPCIFFNRLSGDAAEHGVTCDNVAGGNNIADYLIDLGHTRLLYVSAFPGASTNVERERGFRERAIERGLAPPMIIDAGSFSYEAGFAAALRITELPERPEAVFCANDIVAIGFIEGVRTLGLSVPDDISVVGFDDIAMAAWPQHSLTTVRQPIEEMLAVTVEFARKLSSAPEAPGEVHRIPPGPLIERATTKRRRPR